MIIYKNNANVLRILRLKTAAKLHVWHCHTELLVIGLWFCNMNIYRWLSTIIHRLKDEFLINAGGVFTEESQPEKIL
ncbi:MAG: hypothetical protein HW390_2153 [Candidatus Brocadiaceae bacterium]|nr:hypothetical protein [Candidatus Brocadiaceae bacterium]